MTCQKHDLTIRYINDRWYRQCTECGYEEDMTQPEIDRMLSGVPG